MKTKQAKLNKKEIMKIILFRYEKLKETFVAFEKLKKIDELGKIEPLFEFIHKVIKKIDRVEKSEKPEHKLEEKCNCLIRDCDELFKVKKAIVQRFEKIRNELEKEKEQDKELS